MIARTNPECISRAESAERADNVSRLPVWHPITHDDAECQGFLIGSGRIWGWFGVWIGTTIAHYPTQTVRQRAVKSTGRHIGRVDLSPRRSNL